MNNPTSHATNFQTRCEERENTRPAAASLTNPGSWTPLNKEIAMRILKTWREHRERLIIQRLHLL